MFTPDTGCLGPTGMDFGGCIPGCVPFPVHTGSPFLKGKGTGSKRFFSIWKYNEGIPYSTVFWFLTGQLVRKIRENMRRKRDWLQRVFL